MANPDKSDKKPGDPGTGGGGYGSTYPQYRITFEASPLVGHAPHTVNGPHTFMLAGTSPAIQVELTRNDEAGATMPNLTLRISEVPSSRKGTA